MLRNKRSAVASFGAALTLSLAVLAVPTTASANHEPQFRRGPDPTATALERNGSFTYTSTTVSSFSTPGFGAATIYYPTSTTSGTFGGVAIAPGFTETQSAVSWLGPRLASHGFVVIIFNTNSSFDSPDSRGTQLLAALDYLTNTSSVRARVDRTRLSVMGHSMGGGGTLAAAKARPSLQAAIPMAPYHSDKTWPEVTTPTLVIGAENDTVAPVGSHAEPFYNTVASPTKAYAELNGASHNTTNSANAPTSRQSLAWLKRFVDNDTRYSQFLCPPPPAPSASFQEYRATCPYPV